MATKRPHSAIHPSRLPQIPQEPRHKKPKPSNLTGKTAYKKAHTVNDLKSRIRSLRRLLEHNDDLPATIRVEKERALQSAQHELAETERAKKRSEMIGRWHKVRFFERQRATKRLKRARKELDGAGGEGREGVQRRVEEAEVEVNYAVFFPLEREYVPLFPKKKRDAGDGDGEDEMVPESAADVERHGDGAMWELVKQCMMEGTLEALRNGKLTESSMEAENGDRTVRSEQSTPKKKRRKQEPDLPEPTNRRERRSAAAARQPESDEESEGGFFE